ncbi:MAG TPA: LD-carboxypeptidase [Burkholderiaceae bacterium]|nr:LD-carboxypeptidase [Burkholderiaceae bacterium]
MNGGHRVAGPASPSAPRIDVIAPSGAVLSEEVFEAALTRLRLLGCVVRSRLPSTSWLRFSDTDEGRLAQIHDAARADDVDLVMIARGGYGLSRLLDRIDWPLVTASVRRGVRWVGFSDFTAFQLALLATTGAESWAGPAVYGDFGASEPDPYTLAQFRHLLDGHAPLVEWHRVARGEASANTGQARGEVSGNIGQAPSGALGSGSVEGMLWGGNLTMIASLAGTRWMPEVEEGLLFVEDVAEHPYRIERMLLQLLHTGLLARQRAILFGSFTDWKPSPHDNGFDLGTVARHLEDRIGVPVIDGLPFGHIRQRSVLGVGRNYRLECADQRAGAGFECAHRGPEAGSESVGYRLVPL